MQKALHYSHTLLTQLIGSFPDGIFIDGTLGKGNDLAFILAHENFTGQVYGFDVQSLAIEKTKELLTSKSLIDNKNYQLLLDSHANISSYISRDISIVGAIFNLGYLPGGDHSITTQATSTLSAIETIAHQLVVGGQIILVIYSGHDTGKIEKEQLLSTLATWPQEEFQVLCYEFINQRNHPPMVTVIEKR